MEPTRRALVYQYSAAISASLSAMVAGAWLAWPSSSIAPLLSGELGILVTKDQISTLVALMDFGNVLSPIPSGYLMDSIGRKLTLLLTAALYILSSILAIFGTNVWMLYFARILAGLGKGVAFSVVPIFLGEVASVQIRGSLSTIFIGFLNLGMFYDYVIGPYVSYNVLNWLNLAVPILFAITFVFVPESPYYLIMKGREGSARNSLAKYRAVRREDARSGSPLDDELKGMVATVERDMQQRGRLVDLFLSRSSRRALLIVSLLALFQRLSGISPTLAYSTITMPPTGGGLPPSTYMIFFSVILVLANYLATPLVDNAGRKFLLILSAITSAIATGVASVYYYMERFHSQDVDLDSIRWIPYACLLLYGVTYSLGIGFLPSTLVAELFPTNIKSYAGSVSAIMLAVTSFCVNKAYQAVADAWGVHVMFWIFTVNSICCALFVVFFVFETKGKTFAEIQDVLHSKD